jgi:hypothetical protein
VEVEDVIAIQQLLSLYGHLIDSQDWGRLNEVFTEDAVFDGTDLGWPMLGSLAELITYWTDPATIHPLGHHSTNVVVTSTGPDTATCLSKNVSVHEDVVKSSTYTDTLRRTPDGWRLTSRILTRQRRPVR